MMWAVFLWFYFLIGVGAASQVNETMPGKFIFIVSMLLWPMALGFAISKRA